MKMSSTTILAVACLSAVAPALGIAQDGEQPATATPEHRIPTLPSPAGGTPSNSLPTGLDDPAFNSQVDIFLLGKAWQRHDAALMTDVGLLLAD